MHISEKFINSNQASQIIAELGKDFAVVKNPDYIHPPFELYPLAAKILTPVPRLVAAVMDMDGTTTTTETLCLHSLEYMVRKITDRLSPKVWPGLDRIVDYPHIIGNSTTKHVEYLISKYEADIDPEALKRAYFFAALWFLAHGKDPRRIEEVKNNLVNLGCQELLLDDTIRSIQPSTPEQLVELTDKMLHRYGQKFSVVNFSQKVRAAIDIYYQRYHDILSAIQAGQAERLSAELLGNSQTHLIDPMPGVGEFLALTKGWLGNEVISLAPQIIAQLHKTHPLNAEGAIEHLKKLAQRFQQQPLKIAVVTSSIRYEAEIVLTEVFRVLKQQVRNWPIEPATKAFIMEKFTDFRNVYNGFITASDSSEIRLKPHRDLYSIALHQLGIPKNQFSEVIGFEDSESGTIAIRAAGIGLCVAVPFSDTQHHDLRAAAYILSGGLPEALLKHHLFIKL
ncbi:MAG: hypothetical protein ONB27_11930 [candidate division KSB1 bacterium]|nr:hypothetical protein [candidate division KSB1 bacterium]